MPVGHFWGSFEVLASVKNKVLLVLILSETVNLENIRAGLDESETSFVLIH